MKRIGLIGDIHAEDERLAAALGVFANEGVDQVLFVGDVADGQGDLDRCCALLRDARAVGVRGNHDRWLVEDTMRSLHHAHRKGELTPATLAFLQSLPPVRDVETPLGLLLLCHGVGESDMRRLSADDMGYALETQDELAALLQANRYAIVVGGHTHERMVRRFRASDLRIAGDATLVFVNAGTLARDHTPCCSVLDFIDGTVRFLELDDPSAPRASESFALP
jgi:predicted phosphodiesterase